MRVEIEAQKVDEIFDSVTKEFQREAVLPGFRPGKAPREMVVRKYGKDIEQEVRRKLISDSYKKAIDEHRTGRVALFARQSLRRFVPGQLCNAPR